MMCRDLKKATQAKVGSRTIGTRKQAAKGMNVRIIQGCEEATGSREGNKRNQKESVNSEGVR